MARQPLSVSELIPERLSQQDHGFLSSDSEQNLLVFRVGPCTFCVPAMDIDEIIGPQDITSLPFTSRPVIGIFSHRTGIISAYCLHDKLGLGKIQDRTDGRFIVSTIDEKRVAYWINSVDDIVNTGELKFIRPNTLSVTRLCELYAVRDGSILFYTRMERLHRMPVLPSGDGLYQGLLRGTSSLNQSESLSVVKAAFDAGGHSIQSDHDTDARPQSLAGADKSCGVTSTRSVGDGAVKLPGPAGAGEVVSSARNGKFEAVATEYDNSRMPGETQNEHPAQVDMTPIVNPGTQPYDDVAAVGQKGDVNDDVRDPCTSVSSPQNTGNDNDSRNQRSSYGPGNEGLGDPSGRTVITTAFTTRPSALQPERKGLTGSISGQAPHGADASGTTSPGRNATNRIGGTLSSGPGPVRRQPGHAVQNDSRPVLDSPVIPACTAVTDRSEPAEKSGGDSVALHPPDSDMEQDQAGEDHDHADHNSVNDARRARSGRVGFIILVMLPLAIGIWLWMMTGESSNADLSQTAVSRPEQSYPLAVAGTGPDHDQLTVSDHRAAAAPPAVARRRVLDIKGQDFALIVERPERTASSSLSMTTQPERDGDDGRQTGNVGRNVEQPHDDMTPAVTQNASGHSSMTRPDDDAPSDDHLTRHVATESVHIVVKGDTLWDIAEQYLGDPFRYPTLANLSNIRDPDLIYPGDRIRIIQYTPSSDVGD